MNDTKELGFVVGGKGKDRLHPYYKAQHQMNDAKELGFVVGGKGKDWLHPF